MESWFHICPSNLVNLLADFAGGSFVCALGIMAALLERGSSGKGQVLSFFLVHLLQVIDSNMVEGAAYVGSWLFTKNSPAQWGKPRGENLLDSGVHFYETYLTSDTGVTKKHQKFIFES